MWTMIKNKLDFRLGHSETIVFNEFLKLLE